MLELSADTVPAYLQARGGDSRYLPCEVEELSGGVSNAVFLVRPRTGPPLVLKQARPRLRVQDEWLCPIERIWREVEVLRICGSLLAPGGRAGGSGGESGLPSALAARVPEVYWENREHYLYAMSAAPPGHRTWKAMLLAGDCAAAGEIAAACGRMLAELHGRTWNDAEIARRLGDRSYFDLLRLDPYYRHVARVHRDLAEPIERLIASVWEHRRALVHGDFSPKNLLVWPGQVMLIDFEVGHYGDPAFDLGFFLTHLVLKSIWAGPRRADYVRLADTFWQAYRRSLALAVDPAELADLERRTMMNLAGCLLARIDGKSPVDYLTAEQQQTVRRLARDWLARPPEDWLALRAQLALSED